MGIYKKTLKNINIMQIADFFNGYLGNEYLHEYKNINDIEKQENQAYDKMSEKLRKYMSDEDWNSVLDIINEYLAVSEDIHFVLGMKFLFKIFSQLQE